MIPYANPKLQYTKLKSEIDAAVKRVFEHGTYILGSEVEEFEKEFASFLGIKYCIGVGNGTDALHLALLSSGIGYGDEVATVSHTAVATVSAIRMCHATPIFVDIDPNSYTMDPISLKKSITKNTKAVIPVHLYGHPADMDEIISISKEHDLIIIEDCAQAHGATYNGKRVGNFGDLACFSFYPTKNLGAIGDGGAIVTNNKTFAEKAYLVRQYGWSKKFISQVSGWNSRLDELQAGILRIKLKLLNETNAARCRHAKQYTEGLSDLGLTLPQTQDKAGHVFHLYVIRTKHRDNLLKFLNSVNIGVGIHYPIPVHLQPAYSKFSMYNLPVTEQICHEILSLPMYPELEFEEINTVIKSIKSFLN